MNHINRLSVFLRTFINPVQGVPIENNYINATDNTLYGTTYSLTAPPRIIDSHKEKIEIMETVKPIISKL